MMEMFCVLTVMLAPEPAHVIRLHRAKHTHRAACKTGKTSNLKECIHVSFLAGLL